MRKLLTIAVLWLLAIPLGAQNYSLDASMGVGYNPTKSFYGSFDAIFGMKVSESIGLNAGLRYRTPSEAILRAGVSAGIDTRIGRVGLEALALNTGIFQYNIHDYAGAFLCTWESGRMSLKAGVCNRFYRFWTTDADRNNWTAEPFNCVYRLEYRIIDGEGPFRLSAAVTNMEEFRLERFLQPSLRLDAAFRAGKNVFLKASYIQTSCGVFNLTNSLYDHYLKFGVSVLW